MVDPNPAALTVVIVAAYLGNNQVAVADIPVLIRTTYAALSVTASPISAQPSERPVPAVSVRKSVTPTAVICLDCGKACKMLRRHLGSTHGLSVDNYRTRWNLPADYPVVAPDYAAQRSEMAIKVGLGLSRKSKQVGKSPDLSGRSR